MLKNFFNYIQIDVFLHFLFRSWTLRCANTKCISRYANNKLKIFANHTPHCITHTDETVVSYGEWLFIFCEWNLKSCAAADSTAFSINSSFFLHSFTFWKIHKWNKNRESKWKKRELWIIFTRNETRILNFDTQVTCRIRIYL